MSRVARLARHDAVLHATVERLTAPPCPPTLAAALRHAVFPGGGRLRPRLCYAVTLALDDELTPLTDAAAIAIELLHCASLVHDDLPAFDNADFRRGAASVHRAFGEAIAILVGDALCCAAFETVASLGAAQHHVLPAVMQVIGGAAGVPAGMAAGQAWEHESHVEVGEYYAAKTGRLFEAAAVVPAIIGGHDIAPWRELGRKLGTAYQLADDLADAFGQTATLGKPVGRDRVLRRPSAIGGLGYDQGMALLDARVRDVWSAVPPCRDRHDALAALIVETMARLKVAMPRRVSQ